ncbi:MAG: type-F conjugative transfer system secretin TraK [Chlamydiales bacterium]|nr:type-F conjugative transfer system secretin TraK [Chlamydiales bacterium]
MNQKIKQLLGLFLFWGTNTYAGTQVLNVDSNSRLEASIAKDYLNRIAASNDRITQVFGDEASYAIQVDENRGQIFIKPSEANGLKPISLTVITEMGQVQDLNLKPSDRGASTVLLKGEKKSSESATKAESVVPLLEVTLPIQEKMIRAMKMLASGQFPKVDSEGGDRACPEGFSLSHKGTYQVGPFKGQCYEITNVSDGLKDVEEKGFYSTGDLALSFGKRVLDVSKSTVFWVIER